MFKQVSWTGVVLQRVQSPEEQPPPKLFAADQPSDDEVEVVTEWLAPPVLEGRGLVETPPPILAPASPPLYVPVIQRPAESSDMPWDQDQDKVCAHYCVNTESSILHEWWVSVTTIVGQCFLLSMFFMWFYF